MRATVGAPGGFASLVGGRRRSSSGVNGNGDKTDRKSWTTMPGTPAGVFGARNAAAPGYVSSGIRAAGGVVRGLAPNG